MADASGRFETADKWHCETNSQWSLPDNLEANLHAGRMKAPGGGET